MGEGEVDIPYVRPTSRIDFTFPPLLLPSHSLYISHSEGPGPADAPYCSAYSSPLSLEACAMEQHAAYGVLVPRLLIVPLRHRRHLIARQTTKLVLSRGKKAAFILRRLIIDFNHLNKTEESCSHQKSLIITSTSGKLEEVVSRLNTNRSHLHHSEEGYSR